MNPRVSFIVPLFNKARVVGPCLDSLIEAVTAYGNAELIVVDHGSTDGSREIAEEYAPQATILTAKRGTISAVRNAGAQHATGEVLSFIDSDCVVPRDYASRLVAVFQGAPTHVTGCQVGLPPSPTWVEEVWHRLHWRVGDGDRNYINSGSFALTRKAFDTVGGFNEGLVTGEDAEICQRLRDAGFRVFESKSLVVAHLDNAKTMRDFYRKETWRGLGMFGTVRSGEIDKPTAMTVVHLGLCAAAALVLAATPWPPPVRLAAAAGLVAAAPVATLAYRARAGGSLSRPLHAFVLYEVYYAARVTALARLLFRRPKAQTPAGDE